MNTAIIPTSWSGYLLSVLRIFTGLLFFAHGSAKLMQWPALDMFKDGVPLGSLFGIGGVIEIVGGILIVLGLFTRITAFVLAGMMAVAYFMFHAFGVVLPDPEWRRTGNHVLLRVPLFRRAGTGRLEHRRAPRLIVTIQISP